MAGEKKALQRPFRIIASKPPRSVHVNVQGKTALVVTTADGTLKQLPISNAVAHALISNGMRYEGHKTRPDEE
jgi:hypothetical protein